MTKQIGERPHDRLPMTVPFMELKDEHRALREELRKVWDEALDSGAFVGGTGVERFERAFAEFCEVKCAVGVGNGGARALDRMPLTAGRVRSVPLRAAIRGEDGPGVSPPAKSSPGLTAAPSAAIIAYERHTTREINYV